MDLTKQLTGRLRNKGGVATSTTNDAGGYDVLGHLRDAGAFLATGQMPVRASATTSPTSDIDMQLKLQRLKTGDPDFQKELAQTKANAELSNILAAEDAKIKKKRDRQMEAFGQGGQPSMGTTMPSSAPAFANGAMPFDKMGGAQGPKMLMLVPKIDPETGVPIPDYQLVDNPEYLGPKDRQAMEEAKKLEELQAEQAKTGAREMLTSIEEAEKGAKYFGAAGGELPSLLAPSSYNPIKNPLMPLGFDREAAEERNRWAANVEKLTAQKLLDKLNAIRQASKTGASGFGNLTEKELDRLQAASTALNRGLGKDYALQILGEMKAPLLKVLGEEASAPTMTMNPATSRGRKIGNFTIIEEA